MSYTRKKKRNNNFNLFRQKYIPISKEHYTKREDFDSINNKYDYFICGSDQIWNPDLTRGVNPIYFLDFVTDNRKKIAYAASIGKDNLNESQISEIEKLISSFNFLFNSSFVISLKSLAFIKQYHLLVFLRHFS